MATKGSYFNKYLRSIGEDPDTREHSQPTPKIAETAQQRFSTGDYLLIDKPLHWTSFDVVRKIRNFIGIRKVGHAGTLDPLATGLLIICTGQYTKKINEYMAAEKEYTGTITLGAVTPTYDLESQPEQFCDYAHLTTDQLTAAVQALTGTIQQKPPIYSAIKKKGTPLYTLARRGETVDLEPRTVHIYGFELVQINLPEVSFKIRCSTGTYIRSIAHDFGALLGCGAYLSALRRTAIGDFSVAEASTIDQFIAFHADQNA